MSNNIFDKGWWGTETNDSQNPWQWSENAQNLGKGFQTLAQGTRTTGTITPMSSSGNPIFDTVSGAVGTATNVAYDIATKLNKYDKSNDPRTIRQKIGLAYGGKLRTVTKGLLPYVNRFDAGGVAKYANLGADAIQLVGNAFNQANPVTSEAEVNDAINATQNTGTVYTDYDTLEQAQSQYQDARNVTKEEIYGRSDAQDILNSISAGNTGATAGMTFGPWGAVIGGVVGTASSIVGSLFGRRKAGKLTTRLNRAINLGNERAHKSFAESADEIAENTMQNLNREWYDAGGFLNPYAGGGNIHINPKNKGKFTEAAKRAGMGVQEYARHILANKDKYSSTLVKRANFARNAKHFNHRDDGGPNNEPQNDYYSVINDTEKKWWDYDWKDAQENFEKNWSGNKNDIAAVLEVLNDPQNNDLGEFQKKAIAQAIYGETQYHDLSNTLNQDNKKSFVGPLQIDKNVIPERYRKDIKTALQFSLDRLKGDMSKYSLSNKEKEILKENPAWLSRQILANGEGYDQSKNMYQWFLNSENAEQALYHLIANHQRFASLRDGDLDDRGPRYAGMYIAQYGDYPHFAKTSKENDTAIQEAYDEKEFIDYYNNLYPHPVYRGSKSDENYISYLESLARSRTPYTDIPTDEVYYPELLDDKVSLEMLKLMNDPTYNYREYYNNTPDNELAYGESHFPDTYKTGYHPTFSDESIYSGEKSQYNPNGLFGGHWIGEIYIPNEWDQFLSPKRHNFGGELSTNGADFTNGLLEINEGSTHELNPLEGVPMGFDKQGTPNVVEEGETIYDIPETGPYVFSRRGKDIPVPEEIRKKYKLGNKKDLSFAEASKKLAKESEERPNDPLSRAAMDYFMKQLMESQEQVKAEKKAKEQEKILDLMEAAGITLQELAMAQQQPVESISPEELNNLQRTQFAEQQLNAPQAQNVTAYGGKVNMFDDGSSMDQLFEQAVNNKTYAVANNSNNFIPYVRGNNKAADIQKNIDYQNFWKWMYSTLTNNGFPQREQAVNILKYITANNRASAAYSKIFDDKGNLKSDWAAYVYGPKFNGDFDKYDWTGANADLKGAINDNAEGWFHNYVVANVRRDYEQKGDTRTLLGNFDYNDPGEYKSAGEPTISYDPTTNTYYTDYVWQKPNSRDVVINPGPTSSEPAPDLLATLMSMKKPTWQADFPIWANVGQVIRDTFTQPDYTEANTLLGAANASYLPVSYHPIGNYLTYQPLDVNYAANVQRAADMANRRALLNNAGQSRGITTASLLTQRGNEIKGLGDLYQLARQANFENKKTVGEFNKDTNKTNSEGFLKASTSNQGAYDSAANRKLNALEKAMTFRQNERQSVDETKGQNLSNLIASVSNKGKENEAWNRVLLTAALGGYNGLDLNIIQSFLNDSKPKKR